MQHVYTKLIQQLLVVAHRDLNTCTDLLQQAEAEENFMKLLQAKRQGLWIKCRNKAAFTTLEVKIIMSSFLEVKQ